MIKKILLTFVLLIVIAAIVGVFLPANTQVERNIVINKPAAVVFPWVNSLKKFSEWSPWADDDPNMKVTFSGPDEGTGARMQWTSEEQSVGNGSQEIIESSVDSKVVTKLEFGSPSESLGVWTLQANGDAATDLVWSLEVSHGFNLLSRYFGLMLDTWVGPYYDRGLIKLKQRLEAS